MLPHVMEVGAGGWLRGVAERRVTSADSSTLHVQKHSHSLFALPVR